MHWMWSVGVDPVLHLFGKRPRFILFNPVWLRLREGSGEEMRVRRAVRRYRERDGFLSRDWIYFKFNFTIFLCSYLQFATTSHPDLYVALILPQYRPFTCIVTLCVSGLSLLTIFLLSLFCLSPFCVSYFCLPCLSCLDLLPLVSFFVSPALG